MKFVMLAAAAALAVSGVAAPAMAGDTGAKPKAARSCFHHSDWDGWSAPNANQLYLRVNRDVYQVDLSAGSNQLTWGSSHLISTVRGVDTVCSAIDLDLAVSDSSGFSTPLIAKSIRKLTLEEVAAIPKKDLP